MTEDLHLYRLRSLDRLLGKRKELEKQEIYLAPPEDLNDPMEGLQDVLWQGDEILWENLLRHYLLSLLWATSSCAVMDDKTFTELPIYGNRTVDDLPTAQFQQMYADVCTAFFAIDGIQGLPARLASIRKPLRIDGLRFCLSMVHLEAFAAVVSVLRSRDLMPQTPDLPPKAERIASLTALLDALAEEIDPSHPDLEILAFAGNHVREQQVWSVLLQAANGTMPLSVKKWNYLLASFSSDYAKAIASDLIQPAWYTACFSSTCTNASTWATYGDQHRGAALIFRPEFRDKEPFLNTTGLIGAGSDGTGGIRLIRGALPLSLYKVRYTNKAPEIDFFRSINRLSRVRLKKHWHANQNGDQSPLISQALSDEALWRKNLWESFFQVATTKHPDWQHEEEYRLVHHGYGPLEKEHRAVVYDFSHLVGIVFGVRTPTASKIEIIQIIENKCREAKRTDFKFYQMSYQSSLGRLVRV